jgi:hypothetical protein
MRLAILSSVILSACASTASLVPSHPAVARYTSNLDDTRAAVQSVLTSRWMHVDAVGEDGFATQAECRTATGDGCPRKNAWTSPSASSVATYGFQVAAFVVPSSGGVVVRVGATLAGHDGRYEVGKGQVPAWMQQEVDTVQREIAHQLAPVRPNG